MNDLSRIVARMNPAYEGIGRPSSRAFLDLLASRKAAPGVAGRFQSFRLTGQLDAGDGLLFSEKQVVKANEFFDTEGKTGLLILGCLSDYSKIVMQCKTGEIGIVPKSSDESDPAECMRSFSRRGDSLAAFLGEADSGGGKTAFSRGKYIADKKFPFSFRELVDVYAGLGQGSYAGASPAFRNWLRRFDLPRDVLDLFTWFMPTEGFPAGAGGIDAYASLIKMNDTWEDAVAKGYFFLGTCPDGDFIVIDFNAGRRDVGYITHEEIEHGCDFSRHYIRVSPSLSAFFHDSNFLDYLPDDYYQAVELENLK